MSPKRTYQFIFVAFGLSAAAGVMLNLATRVADIGTATAAADAVTVIYRTVVAFHDPDRARFPPD